ncbi:MAG: universal stress protein [Bacteroidota bacterium]
MSIFKLVVPIDFSDTTKDAIHYAWDLARDEKDDDELILVHVLDQLNESEAKEKLESLAEKELGGFEGKVRTAVITGEVEDHIGSFAETENANFVIMGVHETSLLDRLLGSRAMEVISYSKVPFITVQKGTTYRSIDKIAMTIDLDKDSIQVVKAAASLAQNLEAELLLVAGDHADPGFKRQIKSNLTVAASYLEKEKVNYSVELLDRDYFNDKLLELSEERGVDIIAATYYMNTFSILSSKFVQHLITNENKLPVLTVDAQIFSSGPQFPFITT